MHSFEQLAQDFNTYFEQIRFPSEPTSLYEPNAYFLKMGGKRIRPILCLMGNELFDDLRPDCMDVAVAAELFHNFTLIHDDILDNSPLRRGMATVHQKFGTNTAILTGDVMLVAAYEYINKIHVSYLHPILNLFNKTAREVCEGQQMDMDFETRETVSLAEYLRMIELKTSVLLAATLKMGAILGGAGDRNQNLLYEFGKKLGLAFQVQDDYLDAFGDPSKFGKQVGGDIISNKKTFLLIHAFETATDTQQKELKKLLSLEDKEKVAKVIKLFRECKVDEWALQLKNRFLDEAFAHLEDIAVLSRRKEPLKQVAQFLVQRES
jgi:geranylgeranyl diphosphate synthase type II